jgi:hypothetical protein
MQAEFGGTGARSVWMSVFQNTRFALSPVIDNQEFDRIPRCENFVLSCSLAPQEDKPHG